MSPPLVTAIGILGLAGVVFALSAVIVPQGSAYVVESLGRYSRTLDAGVHILTPFIDAIRFRHSLAEQTLTIADVPCRTRDDREVFVDGRLAYRIADPERASYAVAEVREALAAVTRRALGGAVGGVPLDELHASRAVAEAAVVRDLESKTKPWGIVPLRHEITDISRHRKEPHT